MRMVQLTKQEKENILGNLLKRSPNQYDEYQEAVNEILENVKKKETRRSLIIRSALTKPIFLKRPCM